MAFGHYFFNPVINNLGAVIDGSSVGIVIVISSRISMLILLVE